MAAKLVVVWQVTSACSLACPFCRFSRELATARHNTPPEQVERFAALLSDHRQRTGTSSHLSFLGGEPFLWPPIRTVAEKLHDTAAISLGITTNGAALSVSRNRDLLLRCFERVTISIDALAVTHDSLRGRTGLFDALRRSITALTAARDRGGSALRIVVNTVLMRETVPQFAALCAELATWGIDEITFNQLGRRDRPDFAAKQALRPSDLDLFEAQLDRVRAWAGSGGLTILGGASYLARLRATAQNEALRVEECGPGERFLFINELGVVAPCSFTAECYGVPIERITSAEDLETLPEIFRRQKRLCFSPECADCPSTQLFDKFVAPSNQPTARGCSAHVSHA